MAVNEEGKYTKLTPETVKKLEEAFSIDATVEEACFYADISKQTYYNWIDDNEKLKERFDALRQKPILKARKTVVDGLTEPRNAQWYLEKKKANEFGIKQQIDHTTKGEKIANTKDIQDLADEFDKKLEEKYRAGSNINPQLDSKEQDKD